MNSKFLLEQATHLAERLVREVPTGAPDVNVVRIRRVYRLLFGRLPSEEELAVAQEVIRQDDGSSLNAHWVDLAHVLLCSNEFVYID